MARKTVVRTYTPDVVTVKFMIGRVTSAELTFSNAIDAEKVASIWETSSPSNGSVKPPTLSPRKLF